MARSWQILIWNPPPHKDFIRPLGTLNFHLPLGALEFKVFHTFVGGQQGFLFKGRWGVPFPPTKDLLVRSLPV